MVALSDPQWLQGDFRTLVGLFDRVVLKTNVVNTVILVCFPFQATGTQSEAAYGRSMTGAGPLCQERQRGWIQYTECGKDMSLGSLVGHIQTQHGRESEGRRRC